MSFKSDFDENCRGDDLILLDSEGEITSGEGKPDVAFISYEIMFKSLQIPSWVRLIQGGQLLKTHYNVQ